MQIAYTMAPGRGDTDLLLYRLAGDLAAQGVRCCGSVQINTDREDCGPCDMDVRILPDGPVVRISQSLGREAKGCRLDPAALESAVGHTESELRKGAECLIINKFGKHEADGRGFCSVIALAMEQDIPVLVGLNELNREAFERFTGGIAQALPPVSAVLERWILEPAATVEAAQP